MSKLDKAKDFYLRGFTSQYIKRRTSISIQSLLKQLRAQGEVYTKQDIISYQIAYIRDKYTQEEIVLAYIKMSEKHSDLYKACRRKEVICLGCAFGSLRKVMCALLGEEKYNYIRNICWKKKQKKTIKEKYGVENIFCKETFADFVSQNAVDEGRKKREKTILERYGVLFVNQNPVIAERMKTSLSETMLEKYGVDNIMKLPDVAKMANIRRQETMIKKYGAGNSVSVPAIRNKIFEARKNNGTLNSSFAEDALFGLLVDYFGENDVFRNIIVDNRYPYHVDFYVKSRDLFIELNGDKCHYSHWFDVNSVSDRHVVESWMENAQRLEEERGKRSRYSKYIKTWTVTDVAKRECAKTACLNYLVFWDGSVKKVDSHKVAVLSDAREWFRAGCPDSFNWHAENTW